MRFMVIVKATKDSEASAKFQGRSSEVLSLWGLGQRCWTTSAPARLSSTIAGWANRLPRSASALVVVIKGCLGRSLCEASGRTSPFPR